MVATDPPAATSVSDGMTPNERRKLPLLGGASPAAPLAAEARACDRDTRPAYAVWEITLRCDLGCIHCGSRAGKARPDELSTEECLDMVAQMADLGVQEVSLIGGEAYLRDDWDVIAKSVVDQGMLCGIVTGGRNLTDERVKRARDAGVDGMSVSIDGLEKTHDALRGAKGSHAAALRALERLAEHGLSHSVNSQINRRNLHQVPELLELIAPYGIHAWQVQFTVAMGRAADHAHLLLQPYDMLLLMPVLGSLRSRLDELGIRIWPGNNLGYYGPFEGWLRSDMPDGHNESCSAGRHTLGIEANGDIKGCPSLPTADYVGGNIREHRLKDVWERAEALRFNRGRTVDDLWGYCRSCYYAESCLSGCTWTSHVLFGRRGNNPYCHHRALELLAQGKRERLERTTEAAGAPFDHGHFELTTESWPEASRLWAESLARCTPRDTSLLRRFIEENGCID